MKVVVLSFVLLLISSEIIFVESHLDIVFGKIGKTVQKIKCGGHKVANKVFSHNHHNDPCAEISTGHGHDDNNLVEEGNKDVGIDQPLIDVRDGEIGHVTTTTTVQPPQNSTTGRRLISAPSNCPDGYLADSKGVCREEY